MKRFNGNGPLLRALLVVGVVGVMVTGVTFATLQSQQATLIGNSIQSATADLRIGTSASTFDVSRNGFTFKDVVPGGPSMPVDGYSFYLKNYGTAPLSLKVVVGSTPANTSNINLSKVSFELTRVDDSVVQTASLQTLTTSGLSITDPIDPSSVVQYKLRAKMDADAFEGTGAALNGIDLVFSGVVAH